MSEQSYDRACGFVLMLLVVAALAATPARGQDARVAPDRERPEIEAAPAQAPAEPAPAPPSSPASRRGDALLDSGADAFARGNYGAAERDWQQAELAYAAAGDVGGRLDAALNLLRHIISPPVTCAERLYVIQSNLRDVCPVVTLLRANYMHPASRLE